MASDLQPDDVLSALQEAVAEGATDDLEGGVPIPELADRVDRAPNSTRLRDALRELEERGEVAEVWGVNPDSGYSRTSYLPLDRPDETPLGGRSG